MGSMNSNRAKLLSFLFLLVLSGSCVKRESAQDILRKTADAIDGIERIYYKQDMARTNPQNISDTIYRFREMYFSRLPDDSLVGVKGHWYMYVDDTVHIIFEDIYDGNRLIRKNNRDSVTRLYDLVRYPAFRDRPFWGHNTPYGMQFEFRYMLDHADSYLFERLNDTLLHGKPCFQVLVRLEGLSSMPGFAARLEADPGSISEARYLIAKGTYYPLGMKGLSYSSDKPEEKIFIDQQYRDIQFNPKMDEGLLFNTSMDSLKGFEIIEMKPE